MTGSGEAAATGIVRSQHPVQSSADAKSYCGDVDLTPFGAPGNRTFVDPLAARPQFADASGHARYTFSVPNAPILVGVPLSLQWAVIDPAANAHEVVGSNALDFLLAIEGSGADSNRRG